MNKNSKKTQKIAAARLVAVARAARKRAYAPYSGFRVGAAVLCGGGRVYAGCNVENASYGLSVCAERNAVAGAVAGGRRDILAVAVVAGGRRSVAPCGACRQVLAEFNPAMAVIMAGPSGPVRAERLDRMLPGAFGRGDLAKNKRKK